MTKCATPTIPLLQLVSCYVKAAFVPKLAGRTWTNNKKCTLSQSDRIDASPARPAL